MQVAHQPNNCDGERDGENDKYDPAFALLRNSSRSRREVSSATRGASAIMRSSFSTLSRRSDSRWASSSCFRSSGVANLGGRRSMKHHRVDEAIQKKRKSAIKPKIIKGKLRAKPICTH